MIILQLLLYTITFYTYSFTFLVRTLKVVHLDKASLYTYT